MLHKIIRGTAIGAHAPDHIVGLPLSIPASSLSGDGFSCAMSKLDVGALRYVWVVHFRDARRTKWAVHFRYAFRTKYALGA